jgi:hypothetical protein
MTKFWEGLRPAVRDPFTAAFADPEFCRVLDLCVNVGAVAWGLRVATDRKADMLAAAGYGEEAILLRRKKLDAGIIRDWAQEHGVPALAAALTACDPQLAEMLGPRRLHDWLAALVVAVAADGDDTDPDARETALRMLDELAPTSLQHLPRADGSGVNPIATIHTDADGSLVTHVPAETTRRDVLQHESYADSLRPAGKPGRARGAPKSKASGRAPITDAAKRDAVTLTLPVWAKRHAPDLDLADARQFKTARGRFDRARYHGRRLDL